MSLPNFLILGAPKCATTAMHFYLSQHPQVFMSPFKEPPFFEAEYERGLDYYRRKYFSAWNGETVIGESSPSKLVCPWVAQRIHQSLPQVKLLALLRDPVTRAYSSWWMKYSRGLEELSFEKAIEANLTSIEEATDDRQAEMLRYSKCRAGGVSATPTEPFRFYLDSGYYHRQLIPYFELFQPSQIRVVFFEELTADLTDGLQEVFEFLEITPMTSEINLEPRNQSLGSWAATVSQGRSGKLLARFPKRLVGAVQRAATVLGPKAPSMCPKTQVRLRQHFRPANHDLAELLGRRLPWEV